MSNTEQDIASTIEMAGEQQRSEQDRQLAEELVDRARTEGLDLVGPDGVLTGLTKRVLEAGLEAEMTEHLGYDRHAPEGRDGGNSENGTRSKTVVTEVGPVTLDVPRDRDASLTRSWSASASGGCTGWMRW